MAKDLANRGLGAWNSFNCEKVFTVEPGNDSNVSSCRNDFMLVEINAVSRGC